ncbi:UNVERIFIED_CONTAM: FAD-binding oxidoreductase [Kocuria sp. CPCC 205316]|uniref:FAD-binding oxidoreductase n=1 Tax=Kocuria TaxID=57493 RepID=UPI0036D7D9D0
MSTHRPVTAERATDRALRDLAGHLTGVLIGPQDPDYDDARRVWNGMVDVRPRALARAGSVADVDLVLATARRTGLPLAVRGGGHNIAGHSTVADGLVLDLGGLTGVVVDPAARLVTAQPGATLAHVDRATAPHGLAVPLGVVGGTGVAGLTLGGGIGWLTRTHGLTVDNLVSAEVVTAAGEHLHVDGTEQPELFWGLRGGGGNFGVVTSFRYRAHPLASPVLVGGLVYRRPRWEHALAAFEVWARELPDEMNTIVSFVVLPPEYGLGPEVLMTVGFAWASPRHGAGLELVDRLRAAAPPDLETVGPVPWTVWQTAKDPVFPTGSRGYWKNVAFSRLDEVVVSALVAAASEITWVGSGINLHCLRGAFGRVPEDATAWPSRSARFWLNIFGFWRDPADDARLTAYARTVHAALEPFAEPGQYVNFLGAETGVDPVVAARQAYGRAKHERLVELKNRFDPENMFRGNHNIVPTASR